MAVHSQGRRSSLDGQLSEEGKLTVTDRRLFLSLLATTGFLAASPVRAAGLTGGTGDLGLVVERATGSLLVVDRSERAAVRRIEGLGDLSHASLTYSPDERYA